MISQDNKQAMRNPWVLGWMALLGTVVAVNAAFIITAFKTSPGLVEKDYYEKGRYHDDHYQREMASKNRLGWKITLQTPASIIVASDNSYSVSILDKHGNPLKDAKVTVQAYRPSDATADIHQELQPLADGVFQGKLNLPLKGIWDLKVTVAQGEESLSSSRRITAVAN